MKPAKPRISPFSRHSFMPNASALISCIASSVSPLRSTRFAVCFSMIAADERDTPELNSTSDVSSSLMIQFLIRSGLTITRSSG
jgi:hypothetical protein